MPNSSW